MSPPAAEFHRPVALAAIPARGRDMHLAAEPLECAALARRFELPAIARLEASLFLAPLADGRVRATGRIAARVTQVCVVSLEPFEQAVEIPFAVTFLPEQLAAEEAEEAGEGAFDPEAADEEPAPGGVADLGESIAQALSLGLDPWPRRPDAVLPEAAPEPASEREAGPPAGGDADDDALPKSPFAVLARRRR